VLQCVAVCCSVLQCVAVRDKVLRSSPLHIHEARQCVAVRGSVLQCVAVCCSVLQCDDSCVCCSVWKCVAGLCREYL